MLDEAKRNLIRIDELRACITRQHVDDNHLSPFIDVGEKTAQTSIVLMNQINPFRTDMFKGLHCTAIDQLEENPSLELLAETLFSYDCFISQ